MSLPEAPKDRAIAAARQAAQRRTGRAAAPAEQAAGWLDAPKFDQLADHRSLERMREVGAVMGLENPYFRVHQGHASAQTMIGGREIINFASYDYVGLNADPRTAEAAKAAIDRYGVSPSGSRLVSGGRPVHDALEAALARHYGVAAAMCFVSGHSTNVSTIGYLMSEGDLILHDNFVHNSIQVGMKLSGAARRSFAHNDLAALEVQLIESRARFRNALIVIEGHYSMDGDTPPLGEIVALKHKYGCWLMVDEAHALGCVGATGRGVYEHCGIDPTEVDIWMGTLSKSLASTGGYIAGSRALIELLMANASGYVYSVALAPALAASALCALDLLEAEPWRVRKLQENTSLFIKLARKAGLDTGAAEAFSIVPVMVGDTLVAAKLSERLLQRGVNALPVMFPAVPMQSARLRFFLTALHEAEQIETAVAMTRDELQKLREESYGTAVPTAFASL